jgi:hypothetical protein
MIDVSILSRHSSELCSVSIAPFFSSTQSQSAITGHSFYSVLIRIVRKSIHGYQLFDSAKNGRSDDMIDLLHAGAQAEFKGEVFQIGSKFAGLSAQLFFLSSSCDFSSR